MKLEIPDELLDDFAGRVAERLAELAPAAAGSSPETWRTVGLPELAEMLGRSERWCRQQTKNPRDPLPYLRLGDGSKRFDVDDVRVWARRRRVPADDEAERWPRAV